jgi:hypothetical protein
MRTFTLENSDGLPNVGAHRGRLPAIGAIVRDYGPVGAVAYRSIIIDESVDGTAAIEDPTR